jgi:hypothetical protein
MSRGLAARLGAADLLMVAEKTPWCYLSHARRDRSAAATFPTAARILCCTDPLSMPPPAMEAIRPALASLRLSAPRRAPRPLYHCLHTTAARPATPLPHASVPGPPPAKPTPHPSDPLERIARKKRQAELVKQAQEVRTESKPSSKPKSLLKKRFWKDVIVKETDGACCCQPSWRCPY